VKSGWFFATQEKPKECGHEQMALGNDDSSKLLLCAGVIATVVSACAGYSAGTQTVAAATGGGPAAVTIQTFQFRPGVVEVKAGTRVTWINQDDILHTVTSGTPRFNREPHFEAPLEGKGATYSLTFPQAGTYTYFCDRHQSMRGEILVR
jgi:plastocyanin